MLALKFKRNSAELVKQVGLALYRKEQLPLQVFHLGIEASAKEMKFETALHLFRTLKSQVNLLTAKPNPTKVWHL